jgi:hypothetical protein
MVVSHLDISRTFGCPPETDPVLVIDSNAVLTSTVILEGLQLVAWWYAKVAQVESGIQVVKLSPCDITQPFGTRPACRGCVQAVEKIGSPSVSERPDHSSR